MLRRGLCLPLFGRHALGSRFFAKAVAKTAATKMKAAPAKKVVEEEKVHVVVKLTKAQRLARREEKARLAAEAVARGEPLPKKPTRSKNLEELIQTIPKPADPKDRSTFIHKNGFGMKFFRRIWRYPEPCYWTITKYKPRQGSHSPVAWGVLTWRGVTEDKPRRIPGLKKREWRYIPQPDLVWPEGKTPRLQTEEGQAAVRALLTEAQAKAEAFQVARREYWEKTIGGQPGSMALLPQHLAAPDTENNKPRDVGPWTVKEKKEIIYLNVRHFAETP